MRVSSSSICIHRLTFKGYGVLEQFRFVFLLFSRFAGKPEALKAFQCASTVKAVLKHTGELAGDGLLPLR